MTFAVARIIAVKRRSCANHTTVRSDVGFPVVTNFIV